MVFHIAKKEFLNNLLSARFVIGFLLCLVLIPFSILINVDDYRDQANLYRQDKDATDKATKEVRVFSALRPRIVLPPEPLRIFSRGITDQAGNRVKILLGEKPLLAEGQAATRDNPFLKAFFSIDFVGIAAIVLSLLALLFSYDALTREKEDGTLKLMMANSLGRAQVLAGKALGILLTLLPVLVFCYFLGAIIILLSRNLSFSASTWSRIALLFVVSLLYLVVFLFIGLFISSRSKTSVTSLVLCLFVWVFLDFVVPNLSSYSAESFVRIQSRENLTRVLADMDKACAERIAFESKSVVGPDWQMQWYSQVGEDGHKEIYGCTKSFLEWWRQLAMISEPIRIDYADKKWAIEKAYLDSLDRQAGAAERMAMISPVGIFQQVASAICGTDRRTHEKAMAAARTYRETFLDYLREKDIFRSSRWFTPVPSDSFLTADELIEKRTGGTFKTLREYKNWADQQKDFLARFEIMRKGTFRQLTQSDFPYLDISDMPVFAGRPRSAAEDLNRLIPAIGLLLAEAVFLFSLGFAAFIRFDVR